MENKINWSTFQSSKRGGRPLANAGLLIRWQPKGVNKRTATTSRITFYEKSSDLKHVLVGTTPTKVFIKFIEKPEENCFNISVNKNRPLEIEVYGREMIKGIIEILSGVIVADDIDFNLYCSITKVGQDTFELKSI